MTDKDVIGISQLSLVDLAGSERMSRTNNTGQRLREAGLFTILIIKEISLDTNWKVLLIKLSQNRD